MENKQWFSHWTLVETLFVGLFLLAPFYYHENIGGGGLRVPGNITIWMMAIALVCVTAHRVLKRKKLFLPRMFPYLIAVPILLTISGFAAGVEQPIIWFVRITMIWLGFLFFLVILQYNFKKLQIDRLLFVIVVSAFIHALLGFAQIWIPEQLPSWYPHAVYPEGWFQQINNQTTYQVTAVTIVFFLFSRSFFDKKPLFVYVFTCGAIFTGTYLVGVSGSRIGLLTLIISLIIVSFLLIKKQLDTNIKKGGILLVIAVLGLVVGGQSSNNDSIDKVIALQSGYPANMRFGIYAISADLIKQKPVFGHGIGSFPREWQHAKPEFYISHPDVLLPQAVVSHPHNELVLWLVEGGLLAGLAFIVLLITIINKLRAENIKTALLYLALLQPILLHTQVEVVAHTSSLHYFLLILLLSLLFQNGGNSTNINISLAAQKSLKYANIVFFAIAQTFFVHSMSANKGLVSYYKQMQPSNRYLLQKPLKNPYFTEIATWLLMRELLYTSISNNNLDGLQQAIQWTEKELQQNPNVELYFRLINAYAHRNENIIACDYVKKASAIFPDEGQLLKFKEECDL